MLDVDGVPMHDELADHLVPIDKVAEHPENPRQGQVQRIAESVRTNGVYKPIVVQRSTGYILSGNHTYRAITEAGASRVPVTYVDVDDVRARAILLADNRTSELGTFDEVQLAELLTELSAEGDLAGTGYTEEDLSDLLVSMEPPPAPAKPAAPEKELRYNEDGLDITVGFADGQRKQTGRRMLVLDLAVPVWLWLQGALEKIGDDLGLDSNQDVVLKLVSDKVGQPVPAAEEEAAA